MFETQLFQGELVHFTAFDPDKDAEVEAAWMESPDYLHAIHARPAYPLPVHLVKKQHEAYARDVEKNQLFYWAVRKNDDERLIGWARLFSLEWTHGIGEVALAIGSAKDRGQGFGTDAMRMALRFGFNELNLHRLRAVVAGYNDGAQRFVQRFGFVEEVRRREALWLNGQRYDELWFGLLRRDIHGPIEQLGQR